MARDSELSGIIRVPNEARARRQHGVLVAWLSLLLATTMYICWWPVFLHLVPGAIDPAVERIALLSLSVLFLVIGAIPRYRKRIIALSHLALYLTTLHFFSLLWRNDLAAPYVAATFVFLAAVTLSFVTLRLLLIYEGCVVALAILVALHASHRQEAILLMVGVISAVTMMSALSWRNLSLQQAARNKVQAARDFLHGTISAMPDPVFVLDDRLHCLLVNEAIDDITGPARGAGPPTALLQSLTEDLQAALRTDEPVEREIPILRGGVSAGTGLLKLSARHLGDSRYLIGVIRDITVRKGLETKVNQLQGLLPICMHCGRIRRDGEWQELERYVESHSGAVFSHGLCDACLVAHYP
jgi:PAS domain-containing protein